MYILRKILFIYDIKYVKWNNSQIFVCVKKILFRIYITQKKESYSKMDVIDNQPNMNINNIFLMLKSELIMNDRLTQDINLPTVRVHLKLSWKLICFAMRHKIKDYINFRILEFYKNKCSNRTDSACLCWLDRSHRSGGKTMCRASRWIAI